MRKSSRNITSVDVAALQQRYWKPHSFTQRNETHISIDTNNTSVKKNCIKNWESVGYQLFWKFGLFPKLLISHNSPWKYNIRKIQLWLNSYCKKLFCIVINFDWKGFLEDLASWWLLSFDVVSKQKGFCIGKFLQNNRRWTVDACLLYINVLRSIICCVFIDCHPFLDFFSFQLLSLSVTILTIITYYGKHFTVINGVSLEKNPYRIFHSLGKSWDSGK